MKSSVAAMIVGLGVSFAARDLRADEPDGPALLAAIQDSFVKAIEAGEKSVVSIARIRLPSAETGQPMPFQPDFPLEREGRPKTDVAEYVPNEFGAGIVIAENGLILTNYHVVRGGPPFDGKPDQKLDQVLYVRLPDRRGFEARIFAADPRSDLAVLKIAANDLRPIRLGNAASVRKGQFVIALGNPYLIARDGSASASWGIVSNLVRQPELDLDSSGGERRRRETIQGLGVLIQVDTRLELGTSGGALLNLRGELIGITTSLASIVGYEKSAGFAVPIDDATRRIIDSLRQGKEVEYGFLGITMPGDRPLTPDELAAVTAMFKQSGAARVDEVIAGLPAHRAELRPNDLIARVGEKVILSATDLMREVSLLAPGTAVKLQIWRPADRRRHELAVEIGKGPVVNEESLIASVRLREPWRGLVYDYPTARSRLLKTRPEPPDWNSGVLVLEVAPDSPASAGEVRPEDVITHVNDVAVHSPREFQKQVQGENGTVKLRLLSGPGSPATAMRRTVEIKPR
jgi:serine protease Do